MSRRERVGCTVDALGYDRFTIIGQSMGGSVAMKVAELNGEQLDAVVLSDVAGRVDRASE
jgi:pimeloyl-ACP methyl ester carboxylesterase